MQLSLGERLRGTKSDHGHYGSNAAADKARAEGVFQRKEEQRRVDQSAVDEYRAQGTSRPFVPFTAQWRDFSIGAPTRVSWSKAGRLQTGEDSYQSVTCLACSQLHFVNRATGRVLGADSKE